MENKDKILQVDELNLHFKLSIGLFKSPILIKAVDNISFSLFSGETLGIVGESGSGKSSLCRLILKLINKTYAVPREVDVRLLILESFRRNTHNKLTIIASFLHLNGYPFASKVFKKITPKCTYLHKC